MAIDPVFTGTTPGDGTGDKIYEAFEKINENEAELDDRLDTLENSNSNYRYVTYDTYAEMIDAGVPEVEKEIRILDDEDKGIENTIYVWYPDGTRVWVASTEDN